MNCPKCKTQISDNELVCPNCKKVLRLKCHVCDSVTKNSTCEKCGSAILNKCYKCGKLNSTELEKCPNCGLDVNASIGLRESLIEEFAALTIEITNFEDIKHAFKSEKITEQFKKNLYTMIKKIAHQKKLRVQFINDTFIIRFCKDYSFTESCVSAIDFSIYVAQSVSEINQKLFEAKGVALKLQMAVQKRDVYSKPSDYKSGLNISVVYSSSGASHLFSNIEVVVDSYVYQAEKLNYPFQSLSAVFVKNRMVMFFELVLHKIINTEQEKAEEDSFLNLPKNLDYEPEDDEDESSLINFSSLNCKFLRAKNETLLDEIRKISVSGIENQIISVKGGARSGKLSQIKTQDLQNLYQDSRIIRFSCPKLNKYCAYGLLKRMILEYRNIHESEIMVNPALIENISQNPEIQALFRMETQEHSHPEDLRYGYFEELINLFTRIPQKTIFVIDDFEFADESSVEIFQYLVENKELSNLSFIISCSDEYSLHRKIYKLITSENYFEIELKPSSNKTIASTYMKQLSEIKDSFFVEKILENTRGSDFYFKQALDCLTDEKIIEYKEKENKYVITNNKMSVIPKDLNELVQKRISNLYAQCEVFELYSSMLLIGENLSFTIVHSLGLKNDVKNLKYLEKHNFITIVDDKDIILNNYNLYRENLIQGTDEVRLGRIASELLEKIYIKEQIPNVAKANVLEISKLKKEAFSHWHALAMISSQMGDFCAYLNCTNKFLSLVDNVIDSDTDKTVEQVKMDVYTELAALLYKYYPDKILNFLQTILADFELKNDDKKIKEAANKLVQSCLISGNYQNALDYIGKIISRTPKSTFNPADSNFNLNYFLINLVTLDIYFNLGRLNECIELSDELFNYIDLSQVSETILPEGFSRKQFEESILDALFFVSVSRMIQLKPDRREKLTHLSGILGQKFTCFNLLLLLDRFLEGEDIIPEMKEIAEGGLKDKFSEMLFPVLQGLVSMRYKDWNNLGNYAYNAKLRASSLHLHQIEYFCDLLIGYAYQNLSNFKKTRQIYYNVIDLASEKGLKNLTYMCWFLTAKLELAEGRPDVSSGIINNSVINMENDENVSDLFIMLTKSLSSEVSLSQKILEPALFCAEQAYDIALKNKLKPYLPQFADMVGYIYNVIINSDEREDVQAVYAKKLERLGKAMSEIMA